MKPIALLPILLIALAGCQPKPTTTQESAPAPVAEDTPPQVDIELKTPEPDDRFRALVIGNVFYLSDEDSKKFNLTEDSAKTEYEKLPTGERTSKLLALRRSTAITDLKIAAAKLLADQSPSQILAYKRALLEVPDAFLKAHTGLEQAPEFWGDLMTDLYKLSKDQEVLDSLFEHDMDGAAAETVSHARVSIVLDKPESILPTLSDKQLKILAESFEIGSEDPDKDRETIALLAKSDNPKVAAAAKKVLAEVGEPNDSANAQG